MERPEQFKSRAEWEEFIWQKIIKEVNTARSDKAAQEFLESIIGDYEKKLIIRRLTAMLLLKENLNYRAIGEILWVSPSTISAIKKNLAKKTKYAARKKRKLENHATPYQEDALESFIENLENFLEDILKGHSDPKYRWRFLHDKRYRN